MSHPASRQRLGEPVLERGPAAPPTTDPLAGQYVTLRPLEPESDGPDLYARSHGDAATEALWTYMPYGPFADEAAMGAWLAECAASTDPAFRAVLDAEGRPGGMVSYLHIVAEHRRLELGHIWHAPALQHTAANTEAVYLMLCESFERCGCRRVEWKCDALNERSRNAALRLGFRFEGVFRQHMIIKGRNRDTAWYALVDATWPEVKANMERWLYADDPSLSLTAMNASLVEGFHDPLNDSNRE